MRNDEKTNKNIIRAQAFLSKGDSGKEFAIEGKTSVERRASLAGILNAQKRTHIVC